MNMPPWRVAAQARLESLDRERAHVLDYIARKEMEESIERHGVCEHGVSLGRICQPCYEASRCPDPSCRAPIARGSLRTNHVVGCRVNR